MYFEIREPWADGSFPDCKPGWFGQPHTDDSQRREATESLECASPKCALMMFEDFHPRKVRQFGKVLRIKLVRV
jgi:hypothetical protein